MLDGDVETNPYNYDQGKLKPVDELVPLRLNIHVGMRVYLTRNVQKSVDYVTACSAALKIETATLELYASSPSRVTALPFGPGRIATSTASRTTRCARGTPRPS